jgi:hypothetical protein
MNSINRTARTAGLLYLLLVPLGMLGVLVPSNLSVPGDAAATTGNMIASESLVRLGIVSSLLVQVVNIFVVVLLYQLLKSVNKNMARLMVILLLLGVPIAMLNELNRIAALLLSGTGYLAPVTAGQSRSLVPLFLDLYQYGLSIAGIFWGLWLLPMGYLVFKSGFLPRILGILLVIGCFGYLVQSFAALLIPGYSVNLALVTFWGELFLALWLLIKGVDVEEWQQRALATAAA